MSTTLQVRIDAKTKNEAQKILKKLGVDLSTAVKMFLAQVVNKKTLPLEFRDEGGFTPAKRKEFLKEVQRTRKHGEKFASHEEFLADLKA